MNFLDVTLDLVNSEYRPYHKPNNTPLYVHEDSNHPPSVLKQIPLTVQNRVSNLSSNEEVFNREKAFYEAALSQAGYDVTLSYQPTESKQKKRSRKVVWFNPPFCRSVRTPVSQEFLKIIDTCFPKGHVLYKIINRNVIKVSPSCMPNVRSAISASNKQKIRGQQQQTEPQYCNCRQVPCPLDGKCSTRDAIYKAEILGAPDKFFYVGSTACRFIQRFHPHKHSIAHRNSKNSTSLSRKVWQLRDQGHDPKLSFSILKQAKSAGTCAPRCDLFLSEKFHIISGDSPLLLNTRHEIFSKWRHRARFKVEKLLWWNVLFGSS